MKIREQYKFNKAAKIGDTCTCPSCNTIFIKEHYYQAFCKLKTGTKCKDKYWNTIIPKKDVIQHVFRQQMKRIMKDS